jgi:phosphopantetheinyl transferase (holo-ACP synthase)
VDIDFCELPMHRHVRYLDRVCTPQEAVAIRCSVDPVRALATIWAAKEAAFKFFSKQLALAHFVPKKFGFQLQNPVGNLGASPMEQTVSMYYEGLKAEISLFSTENWVHAVAASPAVEILWQVREVDKCLLGKRKANNESEAVRYLTRTLLDELGLQDVGLQFQGRIPRLHSKIKNKQFPESVSLSHHGNYAAVALGRPARLATPPNTGYGNFLESPAPEAVCFTCTA